MNVSSDEPNTDLIIWGSNDDGQLGIGKNHVREVISIPKVCKFRVSIKDVDCGENHTQFLTFDYQVYSMGCNIFGQLGQGESDLTRKCSPHLIESLSDKKIESISSGANYSLALSKYGKVYSWGEGTYGQLGLGKFVNESSPAEMNIPTVLGSSNSKVRQINAGYKHCGLVTEEGQLLLCGANKEGQLGIGNNLSSNKLIVNNYIVDKIESVACGMYHTLVLTNISRLFGFGTNEKGQLGCSSRLSSNIPIPIVGFRSENRIVQLGASNFSGFLDDMGKLYLWGFDKEGGAIDPVKQEQDVSIKDFCSWRDSCAIVDERGRVLTLDEQKYLKSKGESECTFSVMVDNGRRISKAACGNNFFVCIPEVKYTRNPSTPNIINKWDAKKMANGTGFYTSEKKYAKNFSPSSNKEIMENINNEELKISKRHLTYVSDKKKNRIKGYSDYKNDINYQDSKLLIEDLDYSNNQPVKNQTPQPKVQNNPRSYNNLKETYLTQNDDSFYDASKSSRDLGRYTSTKYKYNNNHDPSLTFQSRMNTKNSDLSYSASQRYNNSTHRGSKQDATKRRESLSNKPNKENEDIARFHHNIDRSRINTAKSNHQPVPTQDTEYDSKKYLNDQEKQIQRDVENLAINFNRDFGKSYNNNPRSDTKRANYMEQQLKNAKDEELLSYWKDRAIYLQDELDYKNEETKIQQHRLSALEVKNDQVIQQNLNQDDQRQEIIDVKRKVMEYEKENDILKSEIKIQQREEISIDNQKEEVIDVRRRALEYEKENDILKCNIKVHERDEISFDQIKEEIVDVRRRALEYEKENEIIKSNLTLHERDKLALARKIEAQEETVRELSNKNMELSKLLDDKVYNISGQLEKKQNYLLQECNNQPYKITTTTYQDVRQQSNKPGTISYSYKKDTHPENKPEMDFYKKIEMFEKRDAQRKYERELTPPIGAIVNDEDLMQHTQHSEYDSRKLKLAKSATKQMKILNINDKNQHKSNLSDNKCSTSPNINKCGSKINNKESHSIKRPSNAIRKKVYEDSCYFEPVRRPISSKKQYNDIQDSMHRINLNAREKSGNDHSDNKRTFFNDNKSDLQTDYNYGKYKQNNQGDERRQRYSEIPQRDEICQHELQSRENNNRYSVIEKRARSVREKKEQQKQRLNEYEDKFSGYV